jgi:hypothetical protein
MAAGPDDDLELRLKEAEARNERLRERVATLEHIVETVRLLVDPDHEARLDADAIDS